MKFLMHECEYYDDFYSNLNCKYFANAYLNEFLLKFSFTSVL